MVGNLLRIARGFGLTLLGATFLFFLSAWIGAAVPRNSDWTEADTGVTILVGHNGIHTEIIMPIATETVDWRTHFPLKDIEDPLRDYTHVGVSWGERTFFLETPTWSDLNPITALGALTGGDGLLHAAYYVRPAPAEDFRELRIRTDEYRRLVGEITKDLIPPEDRQTYGGYSSHDVFYDAIGTYHLGNTCNQWTSDRLAQAGIKTG
ncbi:MAG: DUF2459 domain-containing protein, partial [Pseudomonadota bacterium]